MRRDSIDLLNEIVDAWEALAGGREQGVREVERWLANDMKPAIDRIRAHLSRPLPTQG